ncbi:MAG: LamG domain-containing protein [Chitinophagales bacterium]|nr:LamG domain-containing protein [Chitinophagales bacterium]MDW8394378.1 LamG domain-containing protein [Chitinophagales bacterium]
MHRSINRLVILLALLLTCRFAFGQYSLRFYGNGVNAPGLDRVKIPIDNPNKAADVKSNFTIEFWIKCTASDNNGTVSAAGNGDGWITGNVIFDRDIFGSGDYGDFGISIGSCSGCPSGTRVVAFGIDRQGSGATIIGNTHIADGAWHHIAITRKSSNGQIRIYVDGVQDAQGTGPVGDVSYRNKRATSYPNSDPFIVLGAEKHDAGSSYPSYNGYLDELRISKSVRYTSNFTVPAGPFTVDSKTAALYHFDEGSGTFVGDAAPGASHGTLHYGGSPAGPEWVADQPFSLWRLGAGEELPFTRYQAGTLTVFLPVGTRAVEVIDAAGRLWYSADAAEGLWQKDLNLPSGIFFLVVRRDQAVPLISRFAVQY